jgi:hypothetical protein
MTYKLGTSNKTHADRIAFRKHHRACGTTITRHNINISFNNAIFELFACIQTIGRECATRIEPHFRRVCGALQSQQTKC